MASSLAIGNSLASRRHASMRKDLGACTELIPSSETLRRMNGKTVVGNSTPPANPQDTPEP